MEICCSVYETARRILLFMISRGAAPPPLMLKFGAIFLTPRAPTRVIRANRSLDNGA